MDTITNKEFRRLISMAELERRSFDTIRVSAEEENPDFYFTYDIREREIVTAGIDYDRHQSDEILEMVEDYIHENRIDLEDEEDVYNPYDEFGINPEMFL